MQIKLAKAALKTLNHMDRVTQQRMKAAIEAIPKGDIKPLVGMPGVYRLRVGDWRIRFIYFPDDVVFIDKIASRGEIYKGG